ncbi:MAG: TetR/AcrR family transcriptional regulator [Proteobacteria bacterium]|nr:TetR/AcrR family transcriptional regulator [Pseudomonadota bacterium]
MSPRHSSYDAIVDAAETVVMEAGAVHMTLGAVADRAGISKGGLLHHFPTKVALLEAMINRLIKSREVSRKKIWSELPDSPPRELKAFMLSSLLRDKKSDRVGASLLAALAHDPKLAEPVRKAIIKVYTEIVSPGVRFERAAVLALSADGLLLQEILSVSPFTEEQRTKIVEELLRLTDEKME